MRFVLTPLAGVVVVEPEPARDDRGAFARVWCADEFARHGMNGAFVQSSLSNNHRKHTVRGLHYAAEPSTEAKFVRVVAGAIFDAIVDLRPGSPSFGEIFTIELEAGSGTGIYIPAQCAHGFQTLADRTDVLYCMTESYQPAWARTLSWRSPQLAIPWPHTGDGVTISAADARAEHFEPDRAVGRGRSGARSR